MREWYGTFPDRGQLAEDSARKLKWGQLNVCPVYVYCVWCTLLPPLAENFCQVRLQFLSVVDNSKVWGI
jgi:hypothetical protein